jgi:hypothetical protein
MDSPHGAAGWGLRQCFATQRNLGWVDGQPIDLRCRITFASPQSNYYVVINGGVGQ